MTDQRESPRKNAPSKTGADKRADALRENLKKRKAQQNARQNSGNPPTEKKNNDPEQR